MLSQCPQCGLSKSSGAMGSVLPQCRCDWKMPTPQRTWVGLTDEEIKKTAKKHRWHESNVEPHLMPVFRSLEAKLKDKNA